MCEKPLTSSLALADAIAAEEKRSSARVMPIFQCRFGNGIARVRHVIQSGLAGRHYLASIDTAKKRGADYYAVAWRGKFATELGGVLATQAIHIHDLVFWLLGPAAAVSAFKTTRVNPIEVEDCAVASLLMADGSLVSLSATLGSARQAVRMRFCFENVTFEKLGLDDDLQAGRRALDHHPEDAGDRPRHRGKDAGSRAAEGVVRAAVRVVPRGDRVRRACSR